MMSFNGWQIEQDFRNFYVVLSDLRARQVNEELYGAIRDVKGCNKDDELIVCNLFPISIIFKLF